METTKKQKQRKLLWILPLLAIPLITLLFWAMGGGSTGTIEQAVKEKGLNQKLPETALPEESYTKLNYYDKADQDSTKWEDLRKKDPFYGAYGKAGGTDEDLYSERDDQLQKATFRTSNEDAVMKRLKALQRVIQEPVPKKEGALPIRNDETDAESNAEIRKLEAMMASMQSPVEEDKEMQQINGMLENILDIQHPQRVQERLKEAQRSRQGQPLTVASPYKESIIGSLMQEQKLFGLSVNANGFYSLQDNNTGSIAENAIAATIAESQVCVNGSTIKLRLSQEILINDVRIPKNTFVYGVAALKGERLSVEINSIRYQNSVYPVELILYDIDGLEGIFIPGAITRDVAKASADRSMRGIGITTLEDSWGAQAAGAGIEAAKSLFSKKVKLIKVMVKSGYQVLLKEKKNNNN